MKHALDITGGKNWRKRQEEERGEHEGKREGDKHCMGFKRQVTHVSANRKLRRLTPLFVVLAFVCGGQALTISEDNVFIVKRNFTYDQESLLIRSRGTRKQSPDAQTRGGRSPKNTNNITNRLIPRMDRGGEANTAVLIGCEGGFVKQ